MGFAEEMNAAAAGGSFADEMNASRLPDPGPLGRAIINRGPAPSIPARIGTAVKEGILPGIGAVGGATAGGLIASPTGFGVPVGVLGGEALGSALGEYLNQKTGIKANPTESVMPGVTEGTNWQDVGISSLSPIAGRAIVGAGREGIRHLSRAVPGAGVAFQEHGANTMRGAMDWLKGKVGNVEKLYDKVETYNPVIDTPHTLAALDKLGQHYSRNIPNVMGQSGPALEVKSFVEGLKQELTRQHGGLYQTPYTPGPQMSFQKLRGAQKLMNEHFDTGSATLKNAYGEIQAAMRQDLEQAAKNPLNQTAPQAVAALQAANTAFRKEIAYKELEKVMNRAISETTGDMNTTFNRRIVREALRKNPEITKNLTPMEIGVIDAKLKGLGIIPAMPPPTGQAHGAGRALTEGGAAGTLAWLLGMDPTKATALGAATPFALKMVEKGAATEGGKKAILGSAYGKLPQWVYDSAAAMSAAASGSTPR